MPDRPKGSVVLLHGIPSTAPPDPDDGGYPAFAQRVAADGWLAAWVDMRAVRSSKGFFSIEGWVRDARAVIDAVRSTEGAQDLPLAVVGSSAGGAVASELVARGAAVDALVMLAAPAGWRSYAADPATGVRRITEEAGMALPAETRADPTAWFDEFDSVTAERSIAQITVPTLIVHGSADDVVPIDHARRLAERAPRAELRILAGAGHQLRRDNEAVAIVLQWLERVLVAS